MRLLSGQPGSFAAGLLLAYARPVQAVSGNVEIDLLFPQNDTYAPAPIIPVAWALQNSKLADYLQPEISFYIEPYGDTNNSTVAYGLFSMTWTDWESSDPYIEYGEALETLNTEGTWLLVWELSFARCAEFGEFDDDAFFGERDIDAVREGTWQWRVFTTKKGAKEPDLMAATHGDNCADAQNVTVGISDTRDVGDLYENGRPCPVVTEPAPSPTPCSATIWPEAASSISSYLTDRACIAQTDLPSWCPEPEEPEEDGGKRSLVVPSLAVSGAALMAAAVGSLGFL